MSKAEAIIVHEGKNYVLSNMEPSFGDLVKTDNYGVWKFGNFAPKNSNACYAPLPYWANKNTCKKMIEI